MNRKIKKCECGCGNIIESNKRFVWGHNIRGSNNPGKNKSVTTIEKWRQSMVGYKHSLKTKQKMSESHAGIVFSEERRRNISKALKGKKLSRKHKNSISNAIKGEKHFMYGKHWSSSVIENMKKAKAGKNNPNWKGGTGKDPYPFSFDKKLKALIRERDSYTCQLCSKTEEENERRLSIHHIDYIKDNLDPKNLISLCISCNTKVNTGRKHWIKFFRRKLKLRKVI